MEHHEPRLFRNDDKRVRRRVENTRLTEQVCEDWNLSFAEIVDSINDGVLVCGLNGRIAYVNPSLAQMLGYEPEEALGKTVFDFMDDEWARRAARRLNRRRRGIEEKFDHKMRHRDGSEIWGLVSAKPLLDDDGTPIGSLVAVQDITERKNMERKLVDARRSAEKANRAKSEFLANMSHEIRTPMNGILGMLELLEDSGLHDDQHEYVRLARDAAEGLLQLIDDILDFSKIEARQLELHPVEFSLAEDLGKTLQTLVQQAAEKGLELVYHLERQLPQRLIGDPARLRQVVINLVKNAIKFTERGQIAVIVTVEQRLDDQVQLRFAVSDTGRGIPGEKRNEVFEAFRQEDATPSRQHGGTGLGLTIARQLVELMGGKIWLESTEGVGTTVYFTARFGVVSKQDPELRRRVKPLEGLRVLVVDDNHVNRRFIHAVLSDWGMEPFLADSAPRAMELLDQLEESADGVDLAVVDTELPTIAGADLAGQLEARGLPVILMTSQGPGVDISELKRIGIASQVLSPVRPSSLMDAMCEALQLDELAAVDQQEPQEEQPADRPARQLTVLLAEDNPVNQRVTRGLLEKRDHRVILAEDGRQAIEKRFGDDDIDVVLMDVQMPEVDGYEATRAIRKREAETGERIPIIALTAHAMSGDREKVLAAGMDDYLPKPVAADDLYRAVEEIAD